MVCVFQPLGHPVRVRLVLQLLPILSVRIRTLLDPMPKTTILLELNRLAAQPQLSERRRAALYSVVVHQQVSSELLRHRLLVLHPQPLHLRTAKGVFSPNRGFSVWRGSHKTEREHTYTFEGEWKR